ncbi:transposase [Ktedonobacter sp. SOSP1-85]|uniref:transposase n=1 Tax=Ktedonobacter sp. SOSP1-85 TaxID=2778367 RepID=UPI0035B3C5BB
MRKPKGGFQIQCKRWIVERTFGWLIRIRRLARDYEGLPSSSEAFIQVTSIRLLLTRLAPSRYSLFILRYILKWPDESHSSQ